MRFTYTDLIASAETLEAAARHYEERGFFMVDGVRDAVTRHYRPLVAERLQVTSQQLDDLLDPNNPPTILPIETRQRLSRIDTPPELARALLSNLEPVLQRLIGGLLHISSNFHGQFKGGDVKPVDHGGYDPNAQYLEVQGQYLIHQDFSGAALPTSPCGVTLWTPLNSCPDWNLRIYPGTHRFGLLCHEWMKLEDPRLAAFGVTPVDVVAEEGTCVIFNSLLLHSSSNPGPHRRVSCDLRFFPLTAFLPSEVRLLGTDPLATLRAGLARHDGPTLKAPHLEAAAFLGLVTEPTPCPPHSILNWANYVTVLLNGTPAEALPHLARFVNVEQGIDAGVETYTKFHDRERHRATLANLLAVLQARTPAAPEVASLARRLAA
ncbi:MAG: hypothetical protein R2745_20715 [Vicinamibacterales bacterium]